jgi:hypothetical protein
VNRSAALLVLILAQGAAAQARAAPVVSAQVAPTQVVSGSPDHVAVTVYRDRPPYPWMQALGVALITETRTLTLPAGPAVVRFEGVSDQIVPQTAAINGLPSPVLERNFDYDLLSPGNLIAKSLNQPVRLIDTDRKTGKTRARTAVLRSGPDGVMLEVDGRIEAFKCDTVPQRLVFDRIPAGLADRPTLSLRTHAPRAGRYKVRLSYLATGLNWSANYVAHIRPDGATLDLSGWITLANSSGESFHNAPTQVVAGKVALTGDDRPVAVAPVVRRDDCWERKPAWWTPEQLRQAVAMKFRRQELSISYAAAPMMRMAPPPPPPPPPPPMAKEEDLGDYKLYTLPEPTTVAARQTKQVAFLSKQAVPFWRVYRYRPQAWPSDGGPHAPDIVLKLDNTAAGGLGLAIPAGALTVSAPFGSQALLIGAAKLDDTPKGSPLKLTIGRAHTVSMSHRIVSQTTTRVGRLRRIKTQYEVSIVNPLAETVEVELLQATNGRDFRLLDETHAHTTDAGDLVWGFRVGPGERQVLTYTIDAGS